MNFYQHLQLYKRYQWKILLVTVLVTLTVSFFGIKKAGPSVETTIFLNIAAQQQQSGDTASPYETVQAADHFTETVQGWTRNPQFTENIRKKSGEEVGIGARKQEKQNLILTFSSTNEESAQKIAEAVQEELNREITAYNQSAESGFSMALFNVSHEKNSNRQILFPLLGILLGLFLGILLAYLFEILNNLAMFPRQIEDILQKKTTIVPLKNTPEYLNRLIKILGEKNNEKRVIFLIGVNKRIQKALLKVESKKKVTFTFYSPLYNTWPEGDLSEKTPYILITQLGETKLHHLAETKSLLPDDFVSVTLTS